MSARIREYYTLCGIQLGGRSAVEAPAAEMHEEESFTDVDAQKKRDDVQRWGGNENRDRGVKLL